MSAKRKKSVRRVGEQRVPSAGSQEADFEVGKGRPPVERRWKPGTSGNRKGRPKGAKNRKTIVAAAERKTFTVTKGGRRRKLTATEIGLHNLHQEILRGNMKAFLAYLNILHQFGERDAGAAPLSQLMAEDEAILKDFLERRSDK